MACVQPPWSVFVNFVYARCSTLSASCHRMPCSRYMRCCELNVGHYMWLCWNRSMIPHQQDSSALHFLNVVVWLHVHFVVSESSVITPTPTHVYHWSLINGTLLISRGGMYCGWSATTPGAHRRRHSATVDASSPRYMYTLGHSDLWRLYGWLTLLNVRKTHRETD